MTDILSYNFEETIVVLVRERQVVLMEHGRYGHLLTLFELQDKDLLHECDKLKKRVYEHGPLE